MRHERSTSAARSSPPAGSQATCAGATAASRARHRATATCGLACAGSGANQPYSAARAGRDERAGHLSGRSASCAAANGTVRHAGGPRHQRRRRCPARPVAPPGRTRRAPPAPLHRQSMATAPMHARRRQNAGASSAKPEPGAWIEVDHLVPPRRRKSGAQVPAEVFGRSPRRVWLFSIARSWSRSRLCVITR